MKKITKKSTGKSMTIDDLAGIVKNSFVNMEESFDKKLENMEVRLDEKLEEKLEEKLNTKLGSFRAEVNSKFFEVKDQLNVLGSQMTHVERLFDKNDDEHKIFKARLNHLEKVK